MDFEEKVKTELGVSKVPFIMVMIPDYIPVKKVMAFNEIWDDATQH